MYKRIQKVLQIDYDLLINYLLIGFAFSLPISKAGTNIFEVLILLTWLLQGNFREKLLLYRQNLLFISFFIFLLIHFISIPFASSLTFAFEYIEKYRHFLIILPIYSSLKAKYVKHIFSAFLFGMFLSELLSYGIYLEIISYKNASPTNPVPFMDYVSYSVYLAFTSILLLTRLIDKTQSDTTTKLMYALFFLSSTMNLFINGGRTGQVTFIILVFISVFLSLKNKLSSFFLSISLILGILFTAYNYSPNFHNRVNQAYIGLEKILYEDDYTTSDGLTQRIPLWIVGLDSFEDNFLFGKGIGNDKKDQDIYANNRGFDPIFFTHFGDNHNMFLITGLQFGVIGLFSIILIFYSIFILQFKSNVNRILNLTFIVGFFLWSLGNTTFHTMNPMTFFALFAGLFNAIALEHSSTLKKNIPQAHGIKYYVKIFFQREKTRFKGKIIVDFPAGNGVTSNTIANIDATPIPLDLFPEYFTVDSLSCTKANINDGLPLKDSYADAIISQEGIEHFENQLFALKEFNRILKPHGSLIITTPNASNMVGKLSYFLSESELFNKMMPQNELDDIWMSSTINDKDIYYGHIFLIGINKLRLLAKIAGFRIKHIENTRIKTTAFILLFIFYPFIWLSNWRSYRRNLRKNMNYSMDTKKEVYGEIFKLSTDIRLLIDSHIFIEFEKVYNLDEIKETLPGKYKDFGIT